MPTEVTKKRLLNKVKNKKVLIFLSIILLLLCGLYYFTQVKKSNWQDVPDAETEVFRELKKQRPNE